ncbi:MAG TPA: alpha/beta fold hydrolase [Pirellulales bacterium]|nr:alpha/beta fold hydrolase [Pirellulales bacterium]
MPIKRIEVGGAALSVLDAGAGETLLFVHGFPLDHTMWQAQIEAFAPRYRVLAPDLRGFGLSDARGETVTMEEFAGDLAELLDALDERRPVVFCGLSMGGYIALRFVDQFAARLRALVLCDTRAAADSAAAAAHRRKLGEQVLAEGAEPVADAMLPKLFAPRTAAEKPEVLAAARRVMAATHPVAIAAAQRGMAERPDSTALLPTISTPTLVVVGAEDAISPLDEMRGMAAAIPGAEFVVIPNAGHMAPLENPAAFNAALEKFLARS